MIWKSKLPIVPWKRLGFKRSDFMHNSKRGQCFCKI